MKISLNEKHPELSGEWSERNAPLTPEDVSYGSNRMVWWKGTCGHEWQAIIKNRSNGSGCPVCSSRKVIPGLNDLETLFPEIAGQWSERNKQVEPSDVLPYSNRRIWWKCEHGHEWIARIADRTTGHGCPYCCGNTFEEGINDLETLHPQIAKMWSGKNGYLKPYMFSPKSRDLVWWQCPECGYEWRGAVATVVNGPGCHVCKGLKTAAGINDLATTDPELAAEWNFERNDRRPETVQRNALWTVWWKGRCGHEWRARVIDRAVHGEGCKVCGAKFQESLPLLLMTFYTKKLEMKMITKDVTAIGLELEAYIPEVSLAVEFGREKSEEEKQRENVKDYLCRKKEITLVRVAEWSTETELADEILQAFAAADIFIRTDTQADLAIIRHRFFTWLEHNNLENQL